MEPGVITSFLYIKGVSDEYVLKTTKSIISFLHQIHFDVYSLD